jgi:hypothetical protein
MRPAKCPCITYRKHCDVELPHEKCTFLVPDVNRAKIDNPIICLAGDMQDERVNYVIWSIWCKRLSTFEAEIEAKGGVKTPNFFFYPNVIGDSLYSIYLSENPPFHLALIRLL